MMNFEKHTGIFATSGDVRNALIEGNLHNPYIAIVQDGNYIDWNSMEQSRQVPLTFDILSGGTILFRAQSNAAARTVQYRLNGGEWTTITSATGSSAPEIQVEAGDKVEWKGNNASYAVRTDNATRFTLSTAYFNLRGNLMSLIDAENYPTMTEMPSGTHNFWAMFFHTNVVDASELILPIKPREYAFYYFFKDCPTLIKSPVFGGMDPEAAHNTILPNNAFYYTLENCTGLQNIKCFYNRSIQPGQTFQGWVKGLSTGGVFEKYPGDTSWAATSAQNNAPYGWTVQDAVI